MSIIGTPSIEDMTLPESIELQDQLHEDLEELSRLSSPDAVKDQLFVRNLLTEVQDRIGHLTSLLVF